MNSPMFTPSQRQVFIWALIAFALGIALWLLSPVLTPFLLGAILAYILQPGVSWLASKRVPRSIAALLMMLLLVVLATFLLVLVLLVVQQEGPQIKVQVPLLLVKLHDLLQPRLDALGVGINLDFNGIKDLVTSQFAVSTDTIMATLWTSVRTSGNVMITVIGNLVLTPLVLYYLLYDWKRMLGRVANAIPRRWLPKTLGLATEIDQMLSQYLRGQLLVMGVLAAYYTVGLGIARFEIALPVGIFTGLAVFIPYIGYAIGLVLALLAATLQFGTWYGFGAVAVIYGVGQVLESFFLTPRLVGERIGMHPLAVIFALLAFGQLFGFFGVLLALPMSAIILTGLRELRRIYLASALYRD
jgi:predicted PurR-regulated permease PerM